MTKNRRAFTLIELVIGVVVMVVALSAGLISITSARQTAMREAERITAYLHRVMHKAEKVNKNFFIEVSTDSIRVKWLGISTADDSFKASNSCAYSHNFPENKARYNASARAWSSGGTITVKGADGKTMYVVIAIINQGRIRISDTHP